MHTCLGYQHRGTGLGLQKEWLHYDKSHRLWLIPVFCSLTPSYFIAGPPRVAECVIQLIGARQIVSAASLQVREPARDLRRLICLHLYSVNPDVLTEQVTCPSHQTATLSIIVLLVLQDAPANPPLADAVQQPASSEPSFASIACKPGIDGVLPSIVGGQGLAGMSANFTGTPVSAYTCRTSCRNQVAVHSAGYAIHILPHRSRTTDQIMHRAILPVYLVRGVVFEATCSCEI